MKCPRFEEGGPLECADYEISGLSNFWALLADGLVKAITN